MKLAKCHPQRKAKVRGLCGSCYDKELKSRNPGYHERQKANSSAWSKLNVEHRKEYSRNRLEREKKDPDKYKRIRRNHMLKKNYGLTVDDFDAMLKSQKGGCKICTRKPAGGKPLHVDHCHNTGKVRGLLCHQCNWYLGTIEGSAKVFASFMEYITEHRPDYIEYYKEFKSEQRKRKKPAKRSDHS